jgi:hypothetical protein
MMMDNSVHHHGQVVQLTNANPASLRPIQQQINGKSAGELENFLTIRLLMQGKVNIGIDIVIDSIEVDRY